MIEITAPEVYALVDISQHNLEDSAYDLESEIRTEAVEQFAVKEGQEFVGGSGVGEAEGILTNQDIAFTQATSGNVRFLFRRRMGGAVVLAEAMRKLKCAAA